MSRAPIPADAQRLAYRYRGAGRYDMAQAYELVDVVKRTPAQVTVKVQNGSMRKFWIKDGTEVGGRCTVEVVTPAIMDSIQRTRYRGAIQSTLYKMEQEAHKLAHNADLERVSLADLQVILKMAKENLAQIGDWARTAAKAAGKAVSEDDESEPSTD